MILQDLRLFTAIYCTGLTYSAAHFAHNCVEVLRLCTARFYDSLRQPNDYCLPDLRIPLDLFQGPDFLLPHTGLTYSAAHFAHNCVEVLRLCTARFMVPFNEPLLPYNLSFTYRGHRYSSHRTSYIVHRTSYRYMVHATSYIVYRTSFYCSSTQVLLLTTLN